MIIDHDVCHITLHFPDHHAVMVLKYVLDDIQLKRAGLEVMQLMCHITLQIHLSCQLFNVNVFRWLSSTL